MIYNLGKNESKNWIVADDTFVEKFTGKTESIMCQGNGYMGIRAASEEHYLNNVRNTFICGTFNKFYDEVTELPNAADVIHMDIYINDEKLLLNKDNFKNYNKQLDLKNGLLTRSFVYTTKNGEEVLFTFERIVSLKNKDLIVQNVNIKPLNKNVNLKIISGINGQLTNNGTQHFIEGEKRCFSQKYLQYNSKTCESDIDFVTHTAHKFFLNKQEIKGDHRLDIARRAIYAIFDFEIKKEENFNVLKYSNINTSRDKWHANLSLEQLKEKSLDNLKKYYAISFEEHLKETTNLWQKIWDTKDILVDSKNDFDQLSIRFAIYHLEIMTPSFDNRMNIPAKGLTGEGYKGHTFWDTEVFMLPHFIFQDPKAARSLMEYRYNSLQGAHKKAKENGFVGAMFPWESAWITDGEVTPLYGAADVVTGKSIKILTGIIEQHITSCVAYGAYYYYKVSGDEAFMKKMGYELILDTAIFWQSRLEYNKEKDIYEINDVIGPDEYCEHVNNNAFTNYMAHWNIKMAIEYYNLIKENHKNLFEKLNEKLNLNTYYENWRNKIDKIYLPKENEEKIIPQDDTYFHLKKIDLTKYKKSKIVSTIYRDYNQDQISELQVSKQADILVLFYLQEHLFEAEVKKANFYFYESKCLHDSSLSLSTHSILASDLKEKKLAYQLFERACRIDLGPIMTTSDAGIHAASIGGIWQCIVNGFMGVRLVADDLRIEPNLPDSWQEVTAHIFWKGEQLKIVANKKYFTVENVSKKKEIKIKYKNKYFTIDNKTTIDLL